MFDVFHLTSMQDLELKNERKYHDLRHASRNCILIVLYIYRFMYQVK